MNPHSICVKIKSLGIYGCMRHSKDCPSVDVSALTPAEDTEGTSPLGSKMCAFHKD